MRLDTLRLLLVLSVSLNLKVHVVNVVGAYLNAHLKETIYMQQIPGYEDGTNNVLQLLTPANTLWTQTVRQSLE